MRRALRFCAVLAAFTAPLAGLAQPAPPPADAAKPPEPAPASKEVIYQGEATSILGREVFGPDDAMVGRIVDVLVDDFGQPRAAVLDVGGFMGIGNRRIAVAWRALHFTTATDAAKRITLDMTLSQIQQTPAFKSSAKPVTVAAPPKSAPPSP